jgi:pyruvate/2-oxoglutarate/acetoin dehydrogenase E1 component
MHELDPELDPEREHPGALTAPVQLGTALDVTVPYSKPMKDYGLPDGPKIVSAVRAVLA